MNTAAAAVLLSLITPVGVAADPRVLSDVELDGVTAAGVLVDVNSVAAAFGDRTHTLTDADTFAISRKQFDLGVGLTFGHAFACCGDDANVEVGSAALGEGDLVHGVTYGVKRDGGHLAVGFSVGFVVAASFTKPWGMDHEKRLATLKEWNAATADMSSTLRAAAPHPDLSNDE